MSTYYIIWHWHTIDDLNYELLGFKIRASDIKIHVDPKKIDDTEIRVDIPLLLAKDIKVSDGGLINLSYDEVDLGSVYESTIEHVKEYYGLVMSIDDFSKLLTQQPQPL